MKFENNQPYRVHQFHYSASPVDGVSHQMFFIRSALKEIGISGEIFASKLNGLSEPLVFKFAKDKMWDCDLLLIHHSHGNPDLEKLSRIEVPKALVYHNITPAKFYPHDPFLAELSTLGKKQLTSLRQEVVGSFAASEFNLVDLKKHHYSNTQLLPLFDISNELKEVKTKKFHLKKNEPKNILFVGRLTRHKNQALLVKAFFYLKKFLPKNSRLFLIGSQDKTYTQYLKLLIKQLGLTQEVKLTGSVTKNSLEHYYEIADAFVCPSEHEGFCIPLVEAMSRHVPTFFIPKTGVKETMGKSGVSLLTENPMEIAQILSSILEKPLAIKAILESQHQRLLELAENQNTHKVQESILDLVTKIRSTPEMHYEKKGASRLFTPT
jgi:glycosyltransferase involved in cell wall biosynthesis